MINTTSWWALCLVFYLIFLGFHLKTKKNKITLFYYSLLFFYLSGVIGLVFFPFPIQDDLIRANIENNYLMNNFAPFSSIAKILDSKDAEIILKQIGGNILMTLPLGFLIPILFAKFSNLKIFLMGVIFSLFIESFQFLISLALGFTYRITDVDDFILNVIGFTIGFLIYKIISKYVPALNVEKRRN